jgi:F420-dependent oxidoreductase-like protein
VKLSMNIPYDKGIKETAALVRDLESAGLDMAMLPEAYTFDSVSALGYMAALTETIELGTAILNVYSRTPALLGMTAAGLDYVSNGRFFLGLGASGPQVIEGFHAVPYDKPLARTRDVIEVVRKVLRREVLVHDGEVVKIPLPEELSQGMAKPLKLVNHPVRPDVPIWWASLMQKAVESTGELADGWMPIFFLPEKADRVWGDALRRGFARRSPDLGQLQIVAGGPTLVGEDLPLDLVRAGVRHQVALYVGGMGARGKNFYNTICQQYGWEAEAKEVQDLYLDGRKEEAAAALPAELIDGLHLCGPEGFIRDRIAAYREAGVTALSIDPVPGTDAVKTCETMKRLVSE